MICKFIQPRPPTGSEVESWSLSAIVSAKSHDSSLSRRSVVAGSRVKLPIQVPITTASQLPVTIGIAAHPATYPIAAFKPPHSMNFSVMFVATISK